MNHDTIIQRWAELEFGIVWGTLSEHRREYYRGLYRDMVPSVEHGLRNELAATLGLALEASFSSDEDGVQRHLCSALRQLSSASGAFA